jgi:vacuolar-type H+-ATPase subunit E/Vma4
MARVNYQRAAQASGYRPQQVDERKLDRIREAGQRRLQGMQAAADAEIRNRKEVLQAMKENEAYTKGAMQRD